MVKFSYSGTSPATVYTCVRDPYSDGVQTTRKWMSLMIQSGGGKRFVFDKGVVKNIMTLTWNHIDTADLAGILAFLAVVGYGGNSFDFTDPVGNYWTAQFWGPNKLSWVETDVDERDFTIELLVAEKPELIINGGFDSAADSWTAASCTLASVADGASGNCLEITRTGAAFQTAQQAVTFEIGKTYRLSVAVKSGTSGNESFSVSNTDEMNITGTTTAAWVTHTVDFTADHASNTVFLRKNTGTAGTMLFDSISIKEIMTP